MFDNLNEKHLKSMITEKLSIYFGTSSKEATAEQLYKAVVMTVKDILLEKQKTFNLKQREQGKKKLYYLCMEFLVGKSLKNNCYNLRIKDAMQNVLKDFNTSLEELYEFEPDPGLGNGGLGRLAACFMDSLATGEYSAMGFSILYEYGLFKQKIVDGWQIELPDQWLSGGEVWLTPRSDKHFNVRFDGYIEESWTEGKLNIVYKDYSEVEAVPYDMMISGADCAAVSVLRLWKPVATKKFDMQSFTQGDYYRAMRDSNDADLIGKVLYPTDSTWEGKELRLKQQYFFVSASIQNIFSDHIKRIGNIDSLPANAAIHINDTHPAFCIPEMMRIMLDDYGCSWEKAFNIVTKTVAYTNHTVMSEALEKWPEDLIARKLPRIYSLMKEIDRRFCDEARYVYHLSNETVENMSIISHNQIKMANLSIIGSHSVNGVSKLHSEIIRSSIFKDFYNITPKKFKNVTNGIAHRRWLCQSNTALASLIGDCIGNDYYKQPEKLIEFKRFENDDSVLKRLAEIKYENKKLFAEYAKIKNGVIINPDSIFDVQAKRMHEYKRQLLNVLKIISIYDELLINPDQNIMPMTFIFGAKAAPGYYMAKQIIKLISFLSADIAKNKDINKILNVVFMEDYNVTMAEKLMPSAEISQQISLAGKEASGTGNMKFMLNGAITIGTLDGANVEIKEACGADNIFIFGLKSHEVESLWNLGYNSTYYYNKNIKLKRVIDMLNAGFNGTSFSDIAQYLLTGKGIADPYMCLADFSEYLGVHNKAIKTYKDVIKWNKMSLNNIAAAGVFAADRSIKNYAQNIWNISPVL